MSTAAFLNIAHRGARAFAPENTLPAIELARRSGANAVELDVQMSHDGELVIVHDDDLSRCTDVRTKFPERTDDPVSAFKWAELELLDAGSWFVHELAKPAMARQRFLQDLSPEEVRSLIPDEGSYSSGRVGIPRLCDALAWAHQQQLIVVLELKTIPRRYPGIAPKTIALVKELRMESEVVISSFDHERLAEVRRLDPFIATAVLTTERLYRAPDYVLALGADAFHPACSGTQSVINRGTSNQPDTDLIHDLTAEGIRVDVWTENSAPRMRALIEAGVTGIFTDYPNRLAGMLAELRRKAPLRPKLRSI